MLAWCGGCFVFGFELVGLRVWDSEGRAGRGFTIIEGLGPRFGVWGLGFKV